MTYEEKYEENRTTLRETYKSMTITKRNTAKEIGIGVTSLDKLRQQGKIKSRKILGQIMFDISEVSRFLSEES